MVKIEAKKSRREMGAKTERGRFQKGGAGQDEKMIMIMMLMMMCMSNSKRYKNKNSNNGYKWF